MKVVSVWTILITFLFLESCYTPQEGCLDTLASNYAITADKSCEDCCQYPELQIYMVHTMQDSSFNPLDTFVNQLGQRYSILDVRFYLSGFKLQQQANQLKVLETLTPNNATQKITDDVVLWRSVDNKGVIGTVKAYGQFEGLSFNLGIDSTMLITDYDNISAGHPLSKEGKLKDVSGNPVWFFLKFVHYTPEPEVVNLYINKPFKSFSFTIDSLIQTPKGSSVPFRIKADYSLLMKNIDLGSSAENVKNSILGNLSELLIVK
jgi:hypothetical protein